MQGRHVVEVAGDVSVCSGHICNVWCHANIHYRALNYRPGHISSQIHHQPGETGALHRTGGLWLILNHFDCEQGSLATRAAETMQIFMMRYILQILSHWEMLGKEFGRLIEISTGRINQNITWASWGCGSHQSWHLAILDVRWYRWYYDDDITITHRDNPSFRAPQLSPCTFLYPPSDTLNVEYGSVKATCISRIETDPAFKLQTDTK